MIGIDGCEDVAGVHRSENKQERESEIGKQDGRRGIQMNG